jgi:hypothetical protein
VTLMSALVTPDLVLLDTGLGRQARTRDIVIV